MSNLCRKLLFAALVLSPMSLGVTAQSKTVDPRFPQTSPLDYWTVQFTNSMRPLSLITIGEGDQAIELESFASGLVRLRTKDNSFSMTAPPGGTIQCTPDGKTKVQVTRPQKARQVTIKRANLGIAVDEVPEALAAQIDVDCTDMVLVLDVTDGGAAHKAGVRKHDILYELDGESKLSPTSLAKILEHHKPGDVVSLGILRRGEKKTIDVELDEKSESIRYLEPSSFYFDKLDTAKGATEYAKNLAYNYWMYRDEKGRQRVVDPLISTQLNTASTPTPRDASIEELLDELRAQRKRVDRILERLDLFDKNSKRKNNEIR
ncbi:MAG: PDZ domain-containing protein [Planctomycetes bacterium]|nr:PDZ domain-containing protein [Planctomycetota bacterium]